MASTGPYRAKVFSCLRALPEEVFEQGLKRLEADLAKGPVSCYKPLPTALGSETRGSSAPGVFVRSRGPCGLKLYESPLERAILQTTG